MQLEQLSRRTPALASIHEVAKHSLQVRHINSPSFADDLISSKPASEAPDGPEDHATNESRDHGAGSGLKTDQRSGSYAHLPASNGTSPTAHLTNHLFLNRLHGLCLEQLVCGNDKIVSGESNSNDLNHPRDPKQRHRSMTGLLF
ncbi:hypothetical protein [Burkholderia cepacia]|uniref:hypothetical protein n=1 Tax=Burkholderia cepacia TaxID=292 RepID=UPI000F58FE88|nr:hypothetical protein [Burkholderia cepacia]